MILRTAVVLLLGTILAGCGSLFESDNQAPPAELVDYENTLTFNTLWSTDTGDGNDDQPLRLVPAYAQGRIYIADHAGQIQAIDTVDGTTIWQVEMEIPVSGGPGLGEDKIFLGTNKAEIIALGTNDGKELWRSKVSSEVIAVPKATGDIVVVHSIDGKLYGLSAATGERKWAYDRSEPALTLRGNSSPVIDGDTVIAGLSNGVLVNLTLANGEPRWEVVASQPRGRSELERIVDIDADPLIKDGLIYVATYQGEVTGIDQNTGVALWRQKLSVYNDMATDGTQLYVTDAIGKVFALDQQTGAILWQQDKLLNRRLTAPAVLGNHILVGDMDGYVHILSPTDGSQQARVRLGSSPLSIKPLVVEGVAYLYANDGELTALSINPEPATTE